MRKFAPSLFIGLLFSISALPISHFSQRLLYKPPLHKEKITPPLYLRHPQNHLFNSNQGLS